jgi:hypothetical protein
MERECFMISSYQEFEGEYEHLSNSTYLKGAILKGKLWDESKKWVELNGKIRRMRW